MAFPVNLQIPRVLPGLSSYPSVHYWAHRIGRWRTRQCEPDHAILPRNLDIDRLKFAAAKRLVSWIRALVAKVRVGGLVSCSAAPRMAETSGHKTIARGLSRTLGAY
jgi:hypothetical protein